VLDFLTAALAPVLWGTMPAVATETIVPGHPLLIATVRSLGGGLVIMLAFRQLPPRSWHLKILILGMVNVGIVFSLFFISALRVQGGIVAILMALTSFWATLIGWPLLRERPQILRLVLIAFGVAGVALLVKAAAGRVDPIGIAAGIGASASMGCGVVLIKKWGRPASVVVFTGWQLVVGGVMVLGLTLMLEGLPARVTGQTVGGLTYLALVTTVLAYPAWFRGIERVGAQRTAMMVLLVPVVALLIDTALLGKPLTALQGVGVLIIFACLSLDPILVKAPRARQAEDIASPGSAAASPVRQG
jgi:probable blue pigment (indigoidine) exporter